MQQLSVLVMDVKDAFLTVPQINLNLVEIPSWAKADEMRSNGINFWKLDVVCLDRERQHQIGVNILSRQ